VPCLDEQARQLARFVGGDPAGDSEDHSRHVEIVT
jgi:hypothetical protein